MKYRVGSVPYLNAKPMLWSLPNDVEVLYDVPSRLPELLETGDASAILVSSIESLRMPGARVAQTSISSLGAVESVRLFSKVEFDKIKLLALDQSSMTSNALAIILLSELYGCRADTELMAPDLETMLASRDAGLLIGDKGMAQSDDSYFVLDLGEAWARLTGLPFVWAMWTGYEEFSPELASILTRASAEGMENRGEMWSWVESTFGPQPPLHKRYLFNVMDYHLTEEHWRGLTAFGEYLLKYQLIDGLSLPTRIGESIATAAAR
ncbi:MAG: menaquinone biosynthesis protein [Armatimonadetes bacterium]|nr:menaquinone biosynthesis protein [Armatimonadota bacterium]